VTFFVAVIAVTAFLAGAAAAVFVMIVIGIRKVGHPRILPSAGSAPIDAVTRSMLGTGAWPHGPGLGGREAG
jgi:hypothetical protein